MSEATTSPRARRWHRVLSVVAAGALVAAGTPASALWSASNTHTGSAIADVQYPAPVSDGCVVSGGLLGSSVRMMWLAVDGASGYRVQIPSADGEPQVLYDGPNLYFVLSGGLLSGLLGSSGATIHVHAYYGPDHSDPWVSDAHVGWVVTGGGLLSSPRCAEETP